VKRHLDESHFAWIGQFGDASPFYYRILSPAILVTCALGGDLPIIAHSRGFLRASIVPLLRTASLFRWDQEFESGSLQRRVSCLSLGERSQESPD
jgi:Protein of unknown function (DUF3500)